MSRSSSTHDFALSSSEDAAPDGRWTIAQAAEFAAQRDFRLLQYLSRTDALARRLDGWAISQGECHAAIRRDST